MQSHFIRRLYILILVASAIFASACVSRAGEGATALKAEKVEAFVKEFMFWSDVELNYRKEFRERVKGRNNEDAARFEVEGLRRLLSNECKISTSHNGNEVTSNVESFTRDLFMARRMVTIRQIPLSAPMYTYHRDHVTVAHTLFIRLQEYGRVYRDQVGEGTLRINNGNDLVINSLGIVWRAPTPGETTSADALLKEQPYNPLRGLGARYLDGGRFTGAEIAVSPDGNKILFTSLRHESSEIYIMDRDGSNPVRLTDSPYWEMEPVFLPDGKSILYISDQDHLEGDLFMMNVDGSNKRRWMADLTIAALPVFSPDGKKAVFFVNEGRGRGIYISNPDGSDCKHVTDAGDTSSVPTFTPDGKKIVFVAACNNRQFSSRRQLVQPMGVFCVNVDGSGLKELLCDSALMSVVGATGGNEPRILFTKMDAQHQNVLWAVDMDGKNQNFREGPLRRVKLSPDRQWLLFSVSDNAAFDDLYVTAADDTGPARRLTRGIRNLSGEGFSPDSRHVLFLAQPTGAPDRGKGQILSVPIGGGNDSFISNNF